MLLRTFARPLILATFLLSFVSAAGEDGYELWLRYNPVKDATLRQDYQLLMRSVHIGGSSPTLAIANAELRLALPKMLGAQVSFTDAPAEGTLSVLRASDPRLKGSGLETKLSKLGKDGFLITHGAIQGKRCLVVAANEDIGLLYGVFHLLQLMERNEALAEIDVQSSPAIERRILNHWDNLDRTVERGYAGFSLWDWHRLPGYIDRRYHDYARANASIGINGTVLTNVNANALVLTEPYLKKVKALADVFRPYGIRVYLTARFSAPMEIGGLKTADPLDPRVQAWWNEKTAEIYKWVPDFGGFLVKANSEGQPGPQNYGRTHADGANMLAKAVKPHNGIVMWRAFVYSNENPEDRVKQAYDEFRPLDGKFDDNVLVQVKNGPLDFQPREPFHPLFGAMTKTPLMMEFQITQEYLGFATHLVYLGTMFEEVLASDTHQKGPGSTVAKAIDGSLYGHKLNAIAGVANIGNDRNWCGHPFAQSNWYAYGRLAWNPSAKAKEIAEDWIAQTFSTDKTVGSTLSDIMMGSRETLVNYMTPVGLHHIMGWSHHYGPGPWVRDRQRDDWTAVYYHRADKSAIGFDRTVTGSKALLQYHPSVARQYEKASACPEEYLLWFHRLSWDHKMKSGRTLWEEICFRYNDGVAGVANYRQKWEQLKPQIDEERFSQVSSLLAIQHEEAAWWRDACLLYFETMSGRRIPSTYPRPPKDLAYYESLQFPYAPGIRPGW